MTITLFPHQDRGATFLASGPGTKGLFFGMGTGKTITSIEAFKRSIANRVLVIAPPIALPMWQREIEAHAETKAAILKTGRTKIPTCRALVVSYAIAASRKDELRDWLAADISALICDESHALKSHIAQRTKAVLGAMGIVSGAYYAWMLTGTPITRWNDDMYPFLCRADTQGMKQRLGGTEKLKFDLRYTVKQKRQFARLRWPVEMVVGNQNTAELADWVYKGEQPLALRVDLAEVFASMPPLTTNRYDIKLDADAELKAQLEDLEKATLADLQQKLQSKEPALATIRRRIGMAKVKAAVEEIKDRIESGQNVLVGAWHTEVIDALASALRGKGCIADVIDGRCSSMRKETSQLHWNKGETQVLICQIAAAGVSLNLQHGGTQIVVVEEDWSPSIMDQFYARLWRYGQQQHVHVDILTSANKLDKALGRISRTKEREHEKFNAVGREVS
jgi:SNF2 family DNA or RNA helicase